MTHESGLVVKKIRALCGPLTVLIYLRCTPIACWMHSVL